MNVKTTSVRQQGVSILTCTNRPGYFENILRNYKQQLYPVKELIIVLNNDSMKLAYYRKRVRHYRGISVYRAPQRLSLGSCLNLAAGKSRYPILAKFDDDDYYGPYYLREQVKALRRTGAGIVGKGAHLKYFSGKRLLVITTPSQQHRFVRYVAGGSLLFPRKVYRAVRFAGITHGEDVNFMRRTRAKSYKIYATSPYNFVGVRRKNKRTHTWKASDEMVLRGSRFVARTTRFRRYANRPVK